MRTIYKYPLFIKDVQEIETYMCFQVLSIQVQNGIACMWLSVDTRFEKQKVKIHIYGTGQKISDELSLMHAGTFMIENDYLVFHVFIEL